MSKAQKFFSATGKTILLLVLAYFLFGAYSKFGYWIGHFNNASSAGGDMLGLGLAFVFWVIPATAIISLILHFIFQEGGKATKVFIGEIVVMVLITLVAVGMIYSDYWQARSEVDKKMEQSEQVTQICNPQSWNFRWPCEKILEENYSDREECDIEIGNPPKAFSQNCRECIILCE